MREDNWQWYERRRKNLSEINFHLDVDTLVASCRHDLLSKFIPDFLNNFDIKKCPDTHVFFVTSDEDGQYILNWRFKQKGDGKTLYGQTETGVYLEDIPAERNGAEYIIRGALDEQVSEEYGDASSVQDESPEGQDKVQSEGETHAH